MYTTDRLVSFTAHVSKCTERDQNSDQNSDYKCVKCEYVSDDFALYEEHCTTHLNTTLYKCSYCTFICVTFQEFSSHVKAEHKNSSNDISNEKENEHVNKQVKYDSNQEEGVVIDETIEKSKPDDDINASFEFECKECNFYSHSSDKYEQHMNLHSIVRAYSCAWCQHKIKSFDLFTDHISTFHPELLQQEESEPEEIAPIEPINIEQTTEGLKRLKFKCKHCPYSTDWTSPFKKHMVKEHPDKNVYNCELCPFEAMHGKTMRAHKYNAHGVGQSSNAKEDTLSTGVSEEPQGELLECRWCSYETVWLSSYKKHILSRHPGKNVFNCKGCEFGTNHKLVMQRHYKENHPGLAKEYFCTFCVFKCVTKGALTYHINQKHGPRSEQKQIKIEPITHSGTSSPSLDSPIASTVSPSQPSTSTPNVSQPPDIVRKPSSSSKDLKCTLCLFETNSSMLFDRHQNAHTEKIAYHCKLCHYKSIGRNFLRVHMQGHHSQETQVFWKVVKSDNPVEQDEYINVEHGQHVGNMKCDLCPFITDYPARLESHKRAHESTVSYNCQLCPYLTQHRIQLGGHMKRQHPTEVYNPPPVIRAPVGGTKRELDIKSEPGVKSDSSFITKKRKLRTPIKTSTCETCGYVSFNSITYSNHVTAHSSPYSYACKHCLFLNTSYQSFRSHMNKHHPSEIIEIKRSTLESYKFQCDLCEYGNHDEAKLAEHKKHHDNKASFICETCNHIAGSGIKLTRHRKLKHPQLTRKKCPHCEYTTNRKRNFRTHLFAHKNSAAYDCEYCPYKISIHNQLVQHMAYNHPGLPCNVQKHEIEEDSGDEDKGFTLKCEHCPFNCKNAHFLDAHNRAHASKSCLTCEVKDCHFITTFEHSLRKHQEDKHSAGKRVHKCTECAYTTKRYTYLKNHVKAHQSNYSYDCIHCPYKTIKYSLYVCHMEYRHSEEDIDQEEHDIPEEVEVSPSKGAEVLQCTQCLYKTKVPKRLESHMKVHESDKSIKCELCDFMCMGLSILRNHITKEHPKTEQRTSMYKCSKCDFSAGSAVILKSHRRAHNSAVSYDCKYCPYKTVFFNSAQRHYSKNHPDEDFNLEKQDEDGYAIEKPKSSFFYCDYCVFRTIHYKRYCNHISLKHPGQSNGYEEYEVSQVKEEFKKTGLEEEAQATSTYFKCKVCPFNSTDIRTVEEHLTSHPPLIYYMCDYCSHQTVSQATFDTHMMQAHPDQPNRHNWAFQCLFCELQTNDGDEFQSHGHSFEEKTTVGGKKRCNNARAIAREARRGSYICDVCGFNGTNALRLKYHMAAHVDGVKSYDCTECMFKSVVRQSYRRHMKNFHSIDVPPMVGRPTTNLKPKIEIPTTKDEDLDTSASSLKDGGFNPKYKCTICGYDNSSIRSFSNHMEAHNSPKPVCCRLCLYRTNRYGSFNSHMKRTHPESYTHVTPRTPEHIPLPPPTTTADSLVTDPLAQLAAMYPSIKEEPGSPHSEGSLGEIDWSQLEVESMEVEMDYSAAL